MAALDALCGQLLTTLIAASTDRAQLRRDLDDMRNHVALLQSSVAALSALLLVRPPSVSSSSSSSS